MTSLHQFAVLLFFPKRLFITMTEFFDLMVILLWLNWKQATSCIKRFLFMPRSVVKKVVPASFKHTQHHSPDRSTFLQGIREKATAALFMPQCQSRQFRGTNFIHLWYDMTADGIWSLPYWSLSQVLGSFKETLRNCPYIYPQITNVNKMAETYQPLV